MEILKENQIVTFIINGVTYSYMVRDDFVNLEGKNNSIIFSKLGIFDISAFCSRHYGYTAGSGD